MSAFSLTALPLLLLYGRASFSLAGSSSSSRPAPSPAHRPHIIIQFIYLFDWLNIHLCIYLQAPLLSIYTWGAAATSILSLGGTDQMYNIEIIWWQIFCGKYQVPAIYEYVFIWGKYQTNMMQKLTRCISKYWNTCSCARQKILGSDFFQLVTVDCKPKVFIHSKSGSPGSPDSANYLNFPQNFSLRTRKLPTLICWILSQGAVKRCQSVVEKAIYV